MPTTASGMTSAGLGKILLSLRQKHQYSQESIATYLGISQSRYCRIEKGEADLGHLQAINLCRLYKEPYETLLPDGMATAVNQAESMNVEAYKGKYVALVSAIVKLCNEMGRDPATELAPLF